MSYDDDLELNKYIWNNFAHLMTGFERLVGSAIIGRAKAIRIGAKPSHPLYIRWGQTDNPEVNAALADGPEEYRSRVRSRVLDEAGGEVFVNRCARCSRVVRTPLARQCLWCGFDWHGNS